MGDCQLYQEFEEGVGLELIASYVQSKRGENICRLH